MDNYPDVFRVVIHPPSGEPVTIGIRGDSLEDCFREVDDGVPQPTRYNHHRRVEIVRYAPVEVVHTVKRLS